MAPKRPLSPSPSPSPSATPARPNPPPPLSEPTQPATHAIYHSRPIHDRKSTFTAAFSPTAPRPLLTSLPAFAGADHRIAAWRVPSTSTNTSSSSSLLTQTTLTSTKAPPRRAPPLATGFDDDGEAQAGRRLLRLLDAQDTTGTVIVARWWGGVLLGPVRFAHIEAAARDAVGRWKRGEAPGDPGSTAHGGDLGGVPMKRLRVEAAAEQEEEEKAGRERLLAELPQRDESIVALRGLLAEKRARALGGAVVPLSPAKVPDYGKMPSAALARLEKARDATIAFLLKSIDEAEGEAASSSSSKTADIKGNSKGAVNGENGKGKGVEDEVTDHG